ncbi:hypothetical protein LTR36_003188 [Oleoguttula mirabilis]|uniref:Uncharacterized protein n=1 Tax=Oleoguttula mirabilis TaxID=1507867 RepID=A0AAV9JYK1_9PEZI|nr:hypothetical protein LTR36_003188 [Oleoguttula mirabilis]
MDNSLLSRLPPELWNQIYELALHIDEPIALTWYHQHDEYVLALDPSSPAVGSVLALSATCTQARAECLQLFYTTNAFEMHLDGPYVAEHAQAVGRFFRIIGRERVAALRLLTINLGQLHAPGYNRIADTVQVLRPTLLGKGKFRASITGRCALGGRGRDECDEVAVRLEVEQLEASCDRVVAVVHALWKEAGTNVARDELVKLEKALLQAKET